MLTALPQVSRLGEQTLEISLGSTLGGRWWKTLKAKLMRVAIRSHVWISRMAVQNRGFG